ncbi:MAG TPA: DinB family protein [Thermoanaerobaculia bacterium]|nr:DinB family protein [Thermoanaerobaculia bacterium]
MKMTEHFLAQLEAEAPRDRRALEAFPEGRDDWKPHEKSMPFGRLAGLVARMPTWVSMILERDDLDLKPAAGSNFDHRPLRTAAELVSAHDEGVAQARKALKATTEEHLLKPWRLLVAGNTVSEDPRHVVLRDTFMHLSHHRGQLTVYLRLNGAPVPSIYGPTADDSRFA